MRVRVCYWTCSIFFRDNLSIVGIKFYLLYINYSIYPYVLIEKVQIYRWVKTVYWYTIVLIPIQVKGLRWCSKVMISNTAHSLPDSAVKMKRDLFRKILFEGMKYPRTFLIIEVIKLLVLSLKNFNISTTNVKMIPLGKVFIGLSSYETIREFRWGD